MGKSFKAWVILGAGCQQTYLQLIIHFHKCILNITDSAIPDIIFIFYVTKHGHQLQVVFLITGILASLSCAVHTNYWTHSTVQCNRKWCKGYLDFDRIDAGTKLLLQRCRFSFEKLNISLHVYGVKVRHNCHAFFEVVLNTEIHKMTKVSLYQP